ncbi:MAG: hypothetical protein M3Y87_33780, partial [Myxococcota bacterium]|nr:hypothetical protein [Myxococcota bacterium]
PECMPLDRCASGSVCAGGTCVPAFASEGGACGERVGCASALTCVDGRCVSSVGRPCEGSTAECSERAGLFCFEGTCRRTAAGLGESCSDPLPACEPPLTCEGASGAQICIDGLGHECDAPGTIVASRPGAPHTTIVTIDPADPSVHRSFCRLGEGLPDRSFHVTGVSGILHAVARSLDGDPLPFLYTRGPWDCSQGVNTCGGLGRTVDELGARLEGSVLIVEGAGRHEIEVYDAFPMFVGETCDPGDPYRVCEPGSECRDGVCASVLAIPGSDCFCSPHGFVDPGTSTRATGSLRPDQESWYGLLPGRSLRVVPREACPVDLELEIFDGVERCAMRCMSDAMSAIAIARVGDGTGCSPIEVEIPLGAPRELRFGLRSVLGGPFDLEVTVAP